MQNFILHDRLRADTYPVADTEDFYLGLHKNALVPWFILVPKTEATELFACETAFKQRIQTAVDKLAMFTQDYFQADKMNIATIGNVVAQLHIHVIGRQHNDFAWPDPVWGRSEFSAYDATTKATIIAAVRQQLEQLAF